MDISSRSRDDLSSTQDASGNSDTIRDVEICACIGRAGVTRNAQSHTHPINKAPSSREAIRVCRALRVTEFLDLSTRQHP